MSTETSNRILEYFQPPVTINVASHVAATPKVPTIENAMQNLDGLALEVYQLRASRVSHPRAVDGSQCAKEILAGTIKLSQLLTYAPLSTVADASNCAKVQPSSNEIKRASEPYPCTLLK
ncbi:hypothetical protein SprV_0100128100 [Sparganum proliferum]